ncbi:MAG: hypothetical protein AABN34_27030 [Acidobacteriota bacterium]
MNAPEVSALFEFIGKGVTVVGAIAAGWWAFEKWRKRDEHFPRMFFEVTANFLGMQNGQLVVEVIAVLENKGVVPLKIKSFGFKLRGLRASSPLELGDQSIRGQLLFPDVLAEGTFVPASWAYSFIYPGVKTEYNFVTAIPADASFVRVQGDFEYIPSGRSHHAAKILKVPNVGVQPTPASGSG